MKKEQTYKLFFSVLTFLLFVCTVNASTKIIRIRIASGSYSDEIAIRFMPGATAGYDGCCDAWKLFSGNVLVPQLFTRTIDGDELAINSLPSSNTADDVQIFIRTGAITTYSFTTTQLDSFPASASIILTDNVTGNIYDLKTMNTYVINLPAIALGSPARFGVKVTLPVLLPVELTRFVGTSAQEGVKISWTTASEKNNESFIVERAVRAAFPGSGEMQFSAVGNVPGAGNASTESDYEYTDVLPSSERGELQYYRLKQVNFNGTYQYFGPIAVKLFEPKGSEINIYPAVSTGLFFISGNIENAEATVYSMTGQVIYSKPIQSLSPSEPGTIEIQNEQAGIYFLQVSSEGKQTTKKIILNR